MFSDEDVYENYELRLGGTKSNLVGVIQVRLQNEMIWRTLCFPREFFVSKLVLIICNVYYEMSPLRMYNKPSVF